MTKFNELALNYWREIEHSYLPQHREEEREKFLAKAEELRISVGKYRLADVPAIGIKQQTGIAFIEKLVKNKPSLLFWSPDELEMLRIRSIGEAKTWDKETGIMRPIQITDIVPELRSDEHKEYYYAATGRALV